MQSCHLMEKMDLEECSLITDSTIIHLAMNCARLEKLVSAILKQHKKNSFGAFLAESITL
jgi:S-methylmethionine-dependent homocysteine/selenocysteine methylase